MKGLNHPKSYKDCQYFNKNYGKKRAKMMPENIRCKHVTESRKCRRCPQVPQEKLELWAKEKTNDE